MEESNEASQMEFLFKQDPPQFNQCLESFSVGELIKLLEKLLKEENFHGEDGRGCHQLIRSIYKGTQTLPADNSKGEQLRHKILMTITIWLSTKGNDNSAIFDKGVTDLVVLCITEMKNLSESVLLEVTTYIIDALRRGKPTHGKLFAFLPALLSIFASADSITIRDQTSSQVFGGPEYKDFLLNRLCNSKWDNSNVLSLANVFQDIPMTDDQVSIVVDKILRLVETMDINEVPPIIYQLLLLSRKGHKRLILRGIAEYFNKLDEEIFEDQIAANEKQSEECKSSISFSQLALMEGTVIIHLCFAVKQDQELGSEFLKYMKLGKTALLTPFNIACVLSLARIHRFEDQALEFMKNSIIAVFRDTEKLEKSPWISQISPIIDLIPIREIFLRLIKKTSFGWDQATQSLVQLALITMDHAATTLSIVKVPDTSKVRKGYRMNPHEMASELSTHVLLEMFKVHDMVRCEILDQILSRVIGKSGSVISSLNLLDLIVKESPQTLVPYLSKIKETLDYLSYLSVGTADRLLNAVEPIIYSNQNFRDGLMLVLRKSMFAKDLDGRQIALKGFLRLLRLSISEPTSSSIFAQSSLVSGSQSVIKQNPRALSLEILGMLRRFFSQQAEIRKALYQGLMELMDLLYIRQDFIQDVFEMLYPQFLKYFEMETSVHATLRLDLCIENVGGEPFGAEPMAHLIQCISKSVTRISQHNEEDEVKLNNVDSFKKQLAALIERVCTGDITDFGIDSSAEFKTNSIEGTRNNITGSLLMECYEALIEHVFFSEEHSSNVCKMILKLFKSYMQLQSLLTNNPKARKNVSSSYGKSILSFRCISEICQFTFRNGEDLDIMESKMILRNDADFVKYITSAAYNKIAQILPNYNSEDDSTFSSCTSLGQVFMSEFINSNDEATRNQSTSVVEKKKKKSILAIAIECFQILTEVVSVCWPEKLTNFLAMAYPSDKLVSENIPDHLNGWLGLYIREFERLITTLLEQPTTLIPEATGLCQTISSLSKHFTNRNDPPATQVELDQLISWLQTVCLEKSIEDNGFTKIIISMLLNFEKDMAKFNKPSEIACDLLFVMGGIEDEANGTSRRPSEAEKETTKFQIVNSRNTGTICDILIGFLEQIYQDLEWCIERMKISLSSAMEEGSDKNVPERTQMEIAISDILIKMINATIYLERTSLSDVCAEHMIKSLKRTYKVLQALTKYKLSEGNITDCFINVIELAGKHLSENLYKFLTSFGLQTDATRHLGKKGKNKTNLARIARESKMIPALIFMLEQFERYLLLLAKRSKTDLMQYVKRSTARDFRIQLNDEEKDQSKKHSKKNSRQNQKKTKSNGDSQSNQEEHMEDDNNKESQGGENSLREPRKKQRKLG
ncbi:hypothetical protein G9A89_004817 [Geosiphon pyriformis]|nr:hypothetical protein G9A89_004817 [Geosiphon pyriformis]